MTSCSGLRGSRILARGGLVDHESDLHVAFPEVVTEPAKPAFAPAATPGILDTECFAIIVESDGDHGVTGAEIAVVVDDGIAAQPRDGGAHPHGEDDWHAPGDLLLDQDEVAGVEAAPIVDTIARGALLLGGGRLAAAPTGVEHIFVDRQRTDVLQYVERRRGRSGGPAGVIAA